MVLKLFKTIWWLSLLAVLGSFMYVYASLPEEVVLVDEQSTIKISREILFYSVLILLALVNTVVFVFARLHKNGDKDFISWLYGQIITLNFFFIIALSFVSLYNSNEKFDYSRIGWVIYGSVILMIVWAISWPVYTVFRKISNKSIA